LRTIVALRVVWVLLVAIQTDLFTLRAARVMPELVVSGPAEGVTVGSVVVGGAHQTKFVIESGVRIHVDPGGPLETGRKRLLQRHSADQHT